MEGQGLDIFALKWIEGQYDILRLIIIGADDAKAIAECILCKLPRFSSQLKIQFSSFSKVQHSKGVLYPSA
jgi:hypothetical protein